VNRAHAFAERNAAAIARLQARGLADPTLDPLGTAHAMNAMVSRMASLVFVPGLDMAFDTLAELLLQLWTKALGIPRDTQVSQREAAMTARRTTPPGDGRDGTPAGPAGGLAPASCDRREPSPASHPARRRGSAYVPAPGHVP
jgi:hypothetical protein